MHDPKALQLLQEVLNKTRAGRLKWEATASESDYFAVLPGGFALVIVEVTDKGNWGMRSEQVQHVLILRGEGDQELMRITSDFDAIEPVELAQLFELAKRQALRVDATVDRFLGELAKL